METSQSTQLAWLKKFAQDNPLLLLWNTVLLCGGLILLFYHAQLAHLPDFSLGDLAGLMASVTFIGLLFVAFFLFASLLPGLVLRWIQNDWKLFPYRGYFGSWGQTITLLIFPIVLWSSYLFVPDEIRKDWPWLLSPLAFFAIIGLASVLVAWIFAHSAPLPAAFRIWKHPPFWRDVVGLFLWTFLFFFPIDIAVMFATTGEAKREELNAINAVLLLTVFNGAIYFVPRGQVRYVLAIVAFLTAVLLPMISGQSLLIPRAVVNVLSIGHRNAATLTVSGKNCHSLARFGVHCSADDVKDGSIELENVNVLSRVGTSMLIELLLEQTTAPTGNPQQRAGSLTLGPAHRSLYCASNEVCSSCDPLLLERAKLAGQSDDKLLDAYRKSLVCVQMTIPKDEILNISLSKQRRYEKFSRFSLPVHMAAKQEDPAPATK